MSDPLLTDLKARLAEHGITNVALSRAPDQPDAVITISSYGAEPSRDNTADNLPVLERLAAQVITRGAVTDGVKGATDKAWAAYRALVGRHVKLPPGNTTQRHYDWITANQVPYHLGHDQNDRPLIVFNLSVQRHGNVTAPTKPAAPTP